MAGLRARVWYDRVPTDDNPADVLSRAGFDDAHVHRMVSSGAWEVLAVVEPSAHALSFDELWRRAL